MSQRCGAQSPAGPAGGGRQPARAVRVLAALALVVATTGARPALAQDATCPAPEQLQPAHLYGLWQIQLWPEGLPEPASPNVPTSTGVLLFERHPEYPGSVRGELRRTQAGQDLSAQVSGDVTDGVFNLDESEDGKRISAVWMGEPQDCGRAIRGSRRPAEGRPAPGATLQFLLRKLPGWQ